MEISSYAQICKGRPAFCQAKKYLPKINPSFDSKKEKKSNKHKCCLPPLHNGFVGVYVNHIKLILLIIKLCTYVCLFSHIYTYIKVNPFDFRDRKQTPLPSPAIHNPSSHIYLGDIILKKKNKFSYINKKKKKRNKRRNKILKRIQA